MGKRYLDPDPEGLRALPLYVHENQVGVTEAFRKWLEARIGGGPRTRLLLTGGNRRGGKSWIVAALASATCVAIPEAIVWLVSATLERREELERYVREQIPEDWRKYRVREMKFVFPNGSSIRNVTGDDAEALRRGEADLVVYNEPQSMAKDVLTVGAPAIIDQGGLVLFAGNPARRKKGVWFTKLWRAIEDGRYTHGEAHRLDRRDNPAIDTEAGKDIGELLRLVDPESARADDEGIFLEPGDYAYNDHFQVSRNCAARFPDVAPVVTAEIIRGKGVGGGKYDTLCGVDFQGWPFNAGVEVAAVGDPKKPTWYVRRSLASEGDEDYFLDQAFDLWEHESTLFIGDASGTWQDARHTRGRSSFDKFKARRWRIEAPRKKLSDRGEHPANPPREDRINLVNRLLDDGRLIVCMDGAADVATDLMRCEIDAKGRPQGLHAHRTDALGYALWWATPLPGQRKRSVSGEAHSLSGFRRSPTNIF